jgi:hypothetical protein
MRFEYGAQPCTERVYLRFIKTKWNLEGNIHRTTDMSMTPLRPTMRREARMALQCMSYMAQPFAKEPYFFL